jgi:tRNA(Ile)-lysidine synthase
MATAPTQPLADFGVLCPRPAPRPLLRYLLTRGSRYSTAALLMQRTTHQQSTPRRDDLAQQLLVVLKRANLLRPGERLGVAVSGGADSVALLHLLLELREELGCVLCVVHFNHKLRGRVSRADEKFVARLAAQHGLEFFVAEENIAAKAKRERGNLEDVARRARYAFFGRLVQERHLERVAVAHTADDQAETVLAHILRGTGLAGLGGIHPTAGVVLRPLLGIRRADLRAYLRRKRQPWREDASNRDTHRMRARIRHKLVPFLQKKFQPAVVEHLCQLAEFAREDESYLEGQSVLREKQFTQPAQNALRLALPDFLREPRAIQTRLLRRIVERLKPRSGQLSATHVAALLALAEHPDVGKSVQLPGGVEVRRESQSLVFLPGMNIQPASQGRTTQRGYAYEVDLCTGEAELHVVELPCRLHLRVIDWPQEGRETTNTGAVLDRDRLSVPLVLRNWSPGDSMRPLGHQKRHKLARLLNEIGVSRWEKRAWPVLTSGGQIAWVRGLGASHEFAAGSETRAGVVIVEDQAS